MLPNIRHFPDSRLTLKIKHSGWAKVVDSSFSISGCTPSAPDLLSERSFFNFFSTISVVMWSACSGEGTSRSSMSGMLSVSPLVNTLLKCEFKISAFSLSVLALLLSFLSRSDMLALEVLFAFTYLQKSLLLFLISLDKFLSKQKRSALTVDVTSFLILL